MRTFIALNFSSDFKEKISFCKRFKIKGIKWVETENIHLTLVFLGDIINQKNIDILKNLLTPFSNFRKFEISVSETGAFPDFNRPRVLWANIVKGKENIQEIYSLLKENLYKNGFIFEDKFVPHITLGRIKEKLSEKDIMSLKNFKFEDGITDVITSIDIMSSQLTSKGPIYSLVYSEKFKQ